MTEQPCTSASLEKANEESRSRPNALKTMPNVIKTQVPFDSEPIERCRKLSLDRQQPKPRESRSKKLCRQDAVTSYYRPRSSSLCSSPTGSMTSDYSQSSSSPNQSFDDARHAPVYAWQSSACASGGRTQSFSPHTSIDKTTYGSTQSLYLCRTRQVDNDEDHDDDDAPTPVNQEDDHPADTQEAKPAVVNHMNRRHSVHNTAIPSEELYTMLCSTSSPRKEHTATAEAQSFIDETKPRIFRFSLSESVDDVNQARAHSPIIFSATKHGQELPKKLTKRNSSPTIRFPLEKCRGKPQGGGPVPDVNFVLLGSPGVGKSSLVSQFFHSRLPEIYEATMGDTHNVMISLPGTFKHTT